MNAHIPQSYEAMVELEDIAAIPHHIITPRHAKPMIGVYQDTLVGSYRLTQKGVQFTRREFMNLMMWNKRFNGMMPPPRLREDGKERWTGQQVLGALLPPINIDMANGSFDSEKDSKDSDNYVKIKEGDIEQGVVDGDIYMKASKGIIHVTYNDCGSKDTVDLLDALQNTVENFLVLNGFSVGISDLVADDETKKEIDAKIQERKKQLEQLILQVHLDLFDNNTGKTNQKEFEDQAFGILNQATSDAGSTGQKSLSTENRLVAMVRSGSKGAPLNIAQMMACLGQTAIEGKRVPYGFTDRTLPHYKKYDDSAEARGFIESSFIRGLTPQQFFFHAMSGREGLIDTAVKSVTGDTELVIMEDGQMKQVTIGEWIDSHLAMNDDIIQYTEENKMEYLELDKKAFIPTVDADGNVSWGEIKAVTRHDPGKLLYEIKTLGGREVTVTESQSLLIWNEEQKQFLPKLTPEVTTDDYAPVTMNLPVPPLIIDKIDVSSYLPKNEYLYGTDFEIAVHEMKEAMKDREHIPAGWWKSNNGTKFELPYDSKARLQRAIIRSNMANIKSGYVYPFSTNREHTLIPDVLSLDNRNGIFIGLFLAEGNVDIKSGYVQITNNNDGIRRFVKEWFESNHIRYSEEIKVNHVGGTSSCVRGYSTILAKLLTKMLGHGAENKYVLSEAFSAPEEFVIGLLNGYFSGDGTVSSNSIEAGSASYKLIQGVNMLCNRIGIFGKLFTTTTKKNNIGTSNILPSHRMSIRAQWAKLFAEKILLIDDNKQMKLVSLNASEGHRNFTSVNDVVMDKIIEINPICPDDYPKMYDLTIPSTFNFGLANGLQVRDTAETGYIQRKMIKSMEDLTVQHDGTVRDTNNNIIQFHYGEDGINPTKIESQSLPIGKLSKDEITKQFSMVDVDWSTVLKEGTIRENDSELITEYVNNILFDQRMMVEGVFESKSVDSGNIFAPVNLARWVLNIKVRFALKETEKTDLTPSYVLNGIKKIIERTQPYHKIWIALLRFHLAPHKLIVKERFTKDAFDMLMELIIVNHMKAWVQPGDQVGIVAAQSIGEPATQMTLNSVDWDTEILISKNGKLITPKIGEFIDNYYKECDAEHIKILPNNQIYIELNDGNDWQAISCDENGTMKWTKLEAITRHPVINEDGTDTIIKVTLESGREVKATKGKSFLTLQGGKILGINGSDLKIGDGLPIANRLAIEQLGYITKINTRDILPPNEYIYGSEVQKAKEILNTSKERHWFQKNQGKLFTVPYSRSDAFRDAFINGHNSNDIRIGNVYNKHMKNDVSQIPETIELDSDFGFFCGAYLAEGMSNDTQINITNNDNIYLDKIKNLMDKWNVGTHIVSCDKVIEKTGIKGKSTSLIIHSTILAKIMKTWFGRISYEKEIPNWILQSPDSYVKSLIDGYISGDGTVDKRQGTIHATSVSYKLVESIQLILARYGIYSKLTKYMPKNTKFDSVSMIYNLTIPMKYSTQFSKIFTLTIQYKQELLTKHHLHRDIDSVKSKWNNTNDMVWDKIKSIEEIKPLGDGWMYDLTVKETTNFTTRNLIAVKDTFHQAGVASKSAVTRGVPRLNELLKVTKDPKATSLTIYLKPEYRNNKEKAREVVQDLELTILRNITNKVAIYWDENKEDTVVEEDKELLRFYNKFEELFKDEEDQKWSKWLLRLELNREEMFNRNISIQEVVTVINQQFNNSINVVYSDYNSEKLVMRIRIPRKSKDEDSKGIPTDDTASKLDDFTNLKKFQNKLLTSIVIRGLPGIKAATFRKDSEIVENINGKYEKVEQFILDTDGSNYVRVMNHPAVDGTRLYSTNVWDVYEVLGIEATRAILFNEIKVVFKDVEINYRHLCLLCDVMTRFGRLMSTDRYGIKKNDVGGTLAKASFEETQNILLTAALYGEMDPVTGVSANIMMGQPIRGGTAFSQILLDDQALPKLLADIDIDKYKGVLEEEKEGDLLADDDISLDDPCSSAQFQMNLVIPKEKKIMEEEPIELEII